MQIDKKGRRVTMRAAVSLLALFGAMGAAQAIEIDTGNPDISMQWGNTVRYNAGWRMNGQDRAIANSPNTDEGDNSFDRGEMVTNRVDLLTELDVSYRRQVGFRVSAAAWYDAAFDEDVKTGAGLANRGSYIGNEFSGHTKRYHGGLSGEILDAYVFGNFDLGPVPASLKVGRQTNLWGEALVLSSHSVSYAQAPIDAFKATATPGVDAKEVSLPVGQVYGSLQLTDRLSLAAQYYYEWDPTRLAQGGTYLSSTDFLLEGPDRFSLAPGVNLANRGVDKPKGQADWGLAARYNSELLGATVGAYYRVFDERSPTVSLDLARRSYRAIYPEDTKLYGLSLSKNIAGVSVGAEIVHRRDTALASSITDGADEGARGDTWHGLLNAVATFGPTSLWSSAALTGEIAYSKLDRLSSGERYFNGCHRDGAANRDEETGCASREAWQGTVRFSPSWTAVWPGWDISSTASLTYGLDGNSPVLGGGNEKSGSWTVGMTFTYNQQHDFTIAYNDYLATYEKNPANGLIQFSNGSQLQDRGWLSLTYKGSF
ncbi:DUF1302 domain-containing protein [Aromatoleum petrolei]|uniref:DUF1302 family protein n=1 Tax=Aromatoleum petrolei TaxID=76116 RepID=A0ABX1MSY8_9RHOO|nr:DUF1302 domain-containing protein [Aromatoleum petrolei]NMF89713.1 DUF1302 family protein [Aromatoleum petrolei]